MKFVIIASKKDKAGMNIFRFIHENYPSLSHYLIDDESIYADNIDKLNHLRKYDFIIFATKHQSKEKRKTLSIHAPGNWRKAEFGGREGKVCRTSAFFLKHLFKILNKEAEKARLNYELTLEVTHHGPYLEKPCCFIEIGSSEEEWKDKEAGKVIADTIKEAITTFNEKFSQEKYKTAIGIGGPHYCPNFNKIQLNSDLAISHIIPQYVFPITEEMIKQAIEKTKEPISLALLDWKGLKGKERQETIKILESLELQYKRTSEIEK